MHIITLNYIKLLTETMLGIYPNFCINETKQVENLNKRRHGIPHVRAPPGIRFLCVPTPENRMVERTGSLEHILISHMVYSVSSSLLLPTLAQMCAAAR